MKNLILLSIITFVIFSCKKPEDILEDSTVKAPFFLNGTYDNKTINFEIGKDDYFMETDYGRIIRTDGSCVYTLKGFLSQKDSIGYPNSLNLAIYENVADSLSSSFNVDSVFYVGRNIRISDEANDTSNEVLVFYGDPNRTPSVALSATVPQNNYMTINKVEQNGLNDKGQKTVKITFSLVAMLGDYIGANPKQMIANGTFAFAYPF